MQKSTARPTYVRMVVSQFENQALDIPHVFQVERPENVIGGAAR
jgi:hypothetical protein